jgi:heptosyltransferase-2
LTAPLHALVIAPQWVGDAVMTEPLLRLLHARGERLSVAALPSVADVYRAMPHVVQVWEWPQQRGRLQWGQRLAWAREIRQGSPAFTRAYVLPNSFKSALIPWLARIPQRVGYLGEGRLGLLNHRLPNPSKADRPAMVPFYAALAGVSSATSASVRPQLLLPDNPLPPHVQSALGHRPYVVLAPGSEFGPAKRWPQGHFAALSAALHAQNIPVLVLGSAKEQALCAEIAGLNLAGQTTLLQAMQLIAQARAVVSNDSGLMHVAAAFGVPQVALFGSSSPLHTPPLNPQAQVLWLKLPCAPCYQRICPLGHTRCLTDIAPSDVLNSLSLTPS